MKGVVRCVFFQACLWALGLLWPAVALADGMVVPQRAYAVPNIPDQRALIHYTNGTETLVIETSFTGPGTNFAWVVPLPTLPSIKPVSSGLLPTLQTTFQPRVVLSVRHYWLALPIGAFLLWMIRLLRRESFFRLTVIGGVVLLAMITFGPALSPARHRGVSAGVAEPALAQVHVLNRERVGLFDTATIQSSDPGALLRWLSENGFGTPTNMAPVVAEYVREGWVFAAARLDAGAAAGDTHATHPLAFTFPTAQPVYPLRLTARGTASCRIDLYVFGPGRAQVPGFAVERCEQPRYEAAGDKPRLEAGGLQIRHRELAGLVARAPVATKLSAVLDAAAMSRDAYVSWGPYWSSGGKAYAPSAARILSINAGALLLMVLYVLWRILLRRKGRVGFQARRWGYGLVPVALAAGIAVYFSLPRVGEVSMHRERGRFWRIECQVRWLAESVEENLGDTNLMAHAPTPTRPWTPAEFKRLVQAIGSDREGKAALKNHFTGEPIRSEASPGNFILRPVAVAGEDRITLKPVSGYELVWHDLDGAEALTNLVVFPWREGE